MSLRQLPNAITLARMALALPLGLLIRTGDHGLALGVAAVAALSDMLDGFLARRFGWQTTLGGLLDPLADKLLLAACFVALWSIAAVPDWLLLLVLARDLLIVVGALSYRVLIGPVVPQPTVLGKINTAVQIAYVLMWLLRLAGMSISEHLLSWGAIVLAAIAVASGADYVWRWSLRALRAKPGSGP